jgi:hypothetical protein
MNDARVEVVTARDLLGRAAFSVHWTDPKGTFRRAMHRDGRPVGQRRSKMYRMNVDSYVEHLRAKGIDVRLDEPIDLPDAPSSVPAIR